MPEAKKLGEILVSPKGIEDKTPEVDAEGKEILPGKEASLAGSESTPTTEAPGSGAAPQDLGAVSSSVVTPTQVKDEEIEKIEKILAEDLEDVYTDLPEDKKIEFRQEGERAAVEIETLMDKVKTQSRKIFSIIRNWLKIIPGVNKFFLEQEAKIKTDEILDLVEEEKIPRGSPRDKNKI